MEVCPIGFFCFDKNTFMLLIVFVIIVVVYLINTNSNKYDLERINYNEKKLELETIKNKLENTNQSINELKTITNHINNENHFTTNESERLHNPLMGPERSHPYSINRLGVHINIRTRGYVPNYQQVGVLYQEGDDNNKKVFPLYGKPTYSGSRRWLYYTGNDNFSQVKLPIDNKGRSCQDDNGCDELSDGDSIDVVGYNDKFKVNIYNLDKPRYIPYI